jgi:hypothetical protein
MVCRRHGLILPPRHQPVLHSPTWSRGTSPFFRDGSPVTLVMALEEEPPPAHNAMILAHARALRDLALLAKERLGDVPPLSSLESRSLGYNLVLFGGELASAIFNEPWTDSPSGRSRARRVARCQRHMGTAYGVDRMCTRRARNTFGMSQRAGHAHANLMIPASP